MNFQVGDPVVHWSHGIGKITGIEERMIATARYSITRCRYAI